MTALALAAALVLGGSGWPPAAGPVGRAVAQHLDQGLGQSRPGEWVTYRLDGGAGRAFFWRLAVVGEEKDRLGREACWIEIDLGEHHELKAPLFQMKLLVARETGLTGDGISRMLATFGYEKPQELSQEAMASLIGKPPPPSVPLRAPRALLRVRTGGEARVMTSAGTVSAFPVEVMLRGTVLKRLWVSRQVPVLHLASLEIPAIGHQLEVRDFGIDARPQMRMPSPGEPKIRMEEYDVAAGSEVPLEGESDGSPAQRRP